MPVAMLSSSLMTNPQRYGRFNALDTIYSVSGPGMVLINPTSIANSSGTATLGTDGQVSFSSISTVSMNGIFNADFDNYVANIHVTGASTNIGVSMRVRASGTDDSTSSSYTMQQLAAASSTITGTRTTDNKGYWNEITATPSGAQLLIYGPYLTQPTAFRSITISQSAEVQLRDYATIHNQSNSYDGLTLIGNGGTFSGTIQIYGVRS